jgi:hypothetical protein
MTANIKTPHYPRRRAGAGTGAADCRGAGGGKLVIIREIVSPDDSASKLRGP